MTRQRAPMREVVVLSDGRELVIEIPPTGDTLAISVGDQRIDLTSSDAMLLSWGAQRGAIHVGQREANRPPAKARKRRGQ